MQQKFLVTDFVPDGFIEAIERLGYEVDYLPVLDNMQLQNIVHQYYGIVISTHVHLNEEMLKKSSNLKYILRPGSGLDNVDENYAKNLGIAVFNSPEANRDAVGEHAIGLLLSLLNHIPRAWQQVQDGQWVRKPNTGLQIKEKTIGIIGYGNTGSAFAEKLSGFGANILVYDKYKSNFHHRHIQEVSLENIKQQATILSLHVPLTSETHYFINENFINEMANPFYIINTARGRLIETESLLKGIQSGKILGVALDVLENEKLSTFSYTEKQLMEDLIATEKVLITPHIAGWSEEARRNIFFEVLEKFNRHKQGMSSSKIENAA